MILKRSLFFVICPFILGQLSFNGTIKPMVMFNISDQDQMELPFRFTQLRMGYTMGDFDLLVNSALEHRWGENQISNFTGVTPFSNKKSNLEFHDSDTLLI